MALRTELNRSLFAELKTLPESLQLDSALRLLALAGKTSATAFEFDFFRHFYSPAYSILHWLDPDQRLPADFRAEAVRAQACAMFLHLYDDHLVDGQLELDHLALFLRSALHAGFVDALDELVKHGPRACGNEVRQMISLELDRAAVALTKKKHVYAASPAAALAAYCEDFRGEMATWLIVPRAWALACGRSSTELDTIRQLYEDFGIAWRLLDDAQDFDEDLSQGRHHQAVCHCLPEAERSRDPADISAASRQPAIERVVIAVRERLQAARHSAEQLHLDGLARELGELAQPL